MAGTEARPTMKRYLAGRPFLAAFSFPLLPEKAG
jgi:hypothetical protein